MQGNCGEGGMTIRTPWLIDQDNAEGIVVKDDGGNVVHFEDYGSIPDERGTAFREKIVAEARANAQAMVESVNSVAEMRQLCLDAYAVIDVLAKGVGAITTPDGFFDLWNRTGIKLERIVQLEKPDGRPFKKRVQR
jgi:hypothetical protein